MQELREETTELRVDREEMICREAHVERFEDDLERVCEEHGWWHAHYNELQVRSRFTTRRQTVQKISMEK